MSTGLGAFFDELERENEESQKAHEEYVKACQQRYAEAVKQQEAERAEYLMEMQKRYNFTLTDEVIPALERLETLAVNKYRCDDYSYQDSFSKVYVSVQHEVDLYEEGEESPLNKNSCRGAKNWLNAYKHLYKPY